MVHLVVSFTYPLFVTVFLKDLNEKCYSPTLCYNTLHSSGFGSCKTYGTIFNNNTAENRKKNISRYIFDMSSLKNCMYQNKHNNILLLHKHHEAHQILSKPLFVSEFNIELAIQPTALSKLHMWINLQIMMSLMYNILCINKYLDGSTSRVLAAKL